MHCQNKALRLPLPQQGTGLHATVRQKRRTILSTRFARAPRHVKKPAASAEAADLSGNERGDEKAEALAEAHYALKCELPILLLRINYSGKVQVIASAIGKHSHPSAMGAAVLFLANRSYRLTTEIAWILVMAGPVLPL